MGRGYWAIKAIRHLFARTDVDFRRGPLVSVNQVTTMNLRIAVLLVSLAVTAWSQGAFYPASKHGGNYMYNFYIPPAPSSSPWSPDWSPDGKHLAVSMQGSIWTVDPRTGDATGLTYNSRYHSTPFRGLDPPLGDPLFWLHYRQFHQTREDPVEIGFYTALAAFPSQVNERPWRIDMTASRQGSEE